MGYRIQNSQVNLHDFTNIEKAKQANEPMARGIGKVWAIYKKFGPSGQINGSFLIAVVLYFLLDF